MPTSPRPFGGRIGQTGSNLSIAALLLLSVWACDPEGEPPLPPDSAPPGWACEPPAAPNPPTTGYRHQRFALDYPTTEGSWMTRDDLYLIGNPVRISANGSRVVLGFGLDRSDGSSNDPGRYVRQLHVYTPDISEPLWVHDFFGGQPSPPILYSTPGLSHLDVSRDGRGVAAVARGKLHLFACDNPTPVWTFDPSADGVHTSIHAIAFSANGTRLLATVGRKLTGPAGEPRYDVLVFRIDRSTPERVLTIPSVVVSKVSASADGERVLAITTGEDPDDLQHAGGLDARVMLFEGETLRWTYWLTGDCSGCTYEPLLLGLAGAGDGGISADGRRVVAIGPGGKVVKLDADTGTPLWVHEEVITGDPDWIYPKTLSEARIADDGGAITVVSHLTEKDLLYFTDDSGSPAWRAGERIDAPLDYSPDRNPAPNGFALDLENGGLFERYIGLAERPNVWPTTLELPNMHALAMSADGNVVSVQGPWDNDAHDGDGHTFLFSGGFPVPFQVLAEDEPSRDSDLLWSALSADGAYLAALAVDEDAEEGFRDDKPGLRLHVFEIPPGLVLQVSDALTFNITGSVGNIITEVIGGDRVDGVRHIVKPGRAAVFEERMRLTTAFDQVVFDNDFSLCLPWESNKNTLHDWPAGFVSVSELLAWDTPQCLLNALGQSVMVLCSELYSTDERLLDQEYRDYLHFGWAGFTP